MSQLQQKRKDVENSVWYHLLHQYITQVHNQQKDEKNKQLQLNNMGQKLGRNITEIITSNLPIDKFKPDPKVPNVQYIRFIGKEFWAYLFRKNISKLQLSQKGTFYLNDSDFALLNKISTLNSVQKQDYLELWKSLLIGLLEGVLIGLDLDGEINCTITNPALIEVVSQADPNQKEMIEDPFKTEITFNVHIKNK